MLLLKPGVEIRDDDTRLSAVVKDHAKGAILVVEWTRVKRKAWLEQAPRR
jgi:hypothetical protein